ncbi:MAG: hypothetical protein JKY65_19145 [Planctomycetes bacterium]|nr:hypothetical protein [Planctomycetota bacterium]
MTRALSILLALLIASPALAGDLSGIWSVSGKLPDGTTYEGEAGLAKAGPNRYRVQGRAQLSTGRRMIWRARAELNGSTLTLTHEGRRGLISKINAITSGPQGQLRIVGTYLLASDEASFGGNFVVQNSTPVQSGEVIYTKLATPTVTLEPSNALAELASLDIGQKLRIRLRVDPPRAAGLLWLEGPIVRRHRTRSGRREVEIEARQASSGTLKVRLGPSGGPVLMEIPFRVGPGVLETVMKRIRDLKAAGKTPVVIFDLDDTIYDTRYRVRKILHDYGQQISDDRLGKVELSHVRYEMDETLIAAGIPEAEAKGAFGQQVRRAWSRRFFHGDSYVLDGHVAGAIDYVKRCEAAGATIVYVTGRKERWRAQCLAVIRLSGLPDEHLYMKPPVPAGQPKLATHAFKAQVTRGPISGLGTIVAAFDNEPSNANAFRESLPAAGHSVWLDTLWKPSSPALIAGIETLKDYR